MMTVVQHQEHHQQVNAVEPDSGEQQQYTVELWFFLNKHSHDIFKGTIVAYSAYGFYNFSVFP